MWFNGTVSEAIVKAKAEKALLIIFVYGTDEKSQKGIECWENDEIRNICLENNCVALKFAENSRESRQFAEFYPLVCIPIAFFIGNDGKPLEIVVEQLTIDFLKSKLLKSITSLNGEKCKTLLENVPSASSADDVKQLMKELHEKRQKQEAEQEKERELKRREEGKALLNTQEKLKEMELKNAVEERKRDKKADQEHLKRLRAQIAADRAEKQQQYDAMKIQENKESAAKIESSKAKKAAEEAKKRENDEENRKRTRLQFRLPEGGATSETFESVQIFQDIFDFINEKWNLNGKFYLVQMYPRREFSGADMQKNLYDLELAPSAVLMVLKEEKNRPGAVQRYTDNWYTWILSLLALPFITVFNFLYSSIFSGGKTTNTNRNNENRQNKATKSQENFGRQEGNVHRMPGASENDKPADDNATWNGNSTQQM